MHLEGGGVLTVPSYLRLVVVSRPEGRQVGSLVLPVRVLVLVRLRVLVRALACVPVRALVCRYLLRGVRLRRHLLLSRTFQDSH